MYGFVSYEELFGFFKREIQVRIISCSDKSADNPLYIAAIDGAKSLHQSFLIVGELVINKHIYDNKLSGVSLDDARRRFLNDYHDLTILILGL